MFSSSRAMLEEKEPAGTLFPLHGGPETIVMDLTDPQTSLSLAFAYPDTSNMGKRGYTRWRKRILSLNIDLSKEQLKSIYECENMDYAKLYQALFTLQQKYPLLTFGENPEWALSSLSGNIKAMQWAAENTTPESWLACGKIHFFNFANADDNIKDANALAWAIMSGSTEAAVWCRNVLKISRGHYDQTLQVAAFSGSTKMIQFWLDDFFPLLARPVPSDFEHWILAYAAASGSIEAIRHLADSCGIYIGKYARPDEASWTIMNFASMHKSSDIIDYCLKNFDSKYHHTEFSDSQRLRHFYFTAIQHGSVEVLQYCLDNGFVPLLWLIASNGKNILQLAALSGSVEMVHFVRCMIYRKNGSLIPEDKDSQGNDSWWYANESGNAQKIRDALLVPIEELLVKQQDEKTFLQEMLDEFLELLEKMEIPELQQQARELHAFLKEKLENDETSNRAELSEMIKISMSAADRFNQYYLCIKNPLSSAEDRKEKFLDLQKEIHHFKPYTLDKKAAQKNWTHKNSFPQLMVAFSLALLATSLSLILLPVFASIAAVTGGYMVFAGFLLLLLAAFPAGLLALVTHVTYRRTPEEIQINTHRLDGANTVKLARGMIRSSRNLLFSKPDTGSDTPTVTSQPQPLVHNPKLCYN